MNVLFQRNIYITHRTCPHAACIHPCPGPRSTWPSGTRASRKLGIGRVSWACPRIASTWCGWPCAAARCSRPGARVAVTPSSRHPRGTAGAWLGTCARCLPASLRGASGYVGSRTRAVLFAVWAFCSPRGVSGACKDNDEDAPRSKSEQASDTLLMIPTCNGWARISNATT
jgi:hypothetical protein